MKRRGVQAPIFWELRGAGLAELFHQLVVQVRLAIGHRVDDHEPDANLQVGHAFGDERLARLGPVFVGRADELDGRDELRTSAGRGED